MLEPALTPRPIIEELTKNGVSHVICLPDSETHYLYEQMRAEESLSLVPVCREGETLAIAAGLWVGGKRPVVLIQNTGLFEAGDSIRGLGVDVNLPVVIIVGYRGWTRHGVTPDSAGRITEPTLNAWGINYFLVETDDDVGRLSLSFEEAERTNRPVACLMGAEYV